MYNTQHSRHRQSNKYTITTNASGHYLHTYAVEVVCFTQLLYSFAPSALSTAHIMELQTMTLAMSFNTAKYAHPRTQGSADCEGKSHQEGDTR